MLEYVKMFDKIKVSFIYIAIFHLASPIFVSAQAKCLPSLARFCDGRSHLCRVEMRIGPTCLFHHSLYQCDQYQTYDIGSYLYELK